MIDRDDLLAWVYALQKRYAAEKAHLTELDAAIGDADHGVNMDRGFQAVVAEVENHPTPDSAALLKTVAMTLIKTVGGAAGPLYGTFFLRAGASCAEKTHLSPADVTALFRAGLAGVIQRGKAAPNDKTMIDALGPGIEAMQQALDAGAGLKEMLARAAAAAEAGMRNTVPMQARKGRASYLGERSIGHQDPGATSAWLLLKVAAEVWIRFH